MQPSRVDRVIRRAIRHISRMASEPNTALENRQPNEFSPNSHSPTAMSSLPTSGCTTYSPHAGAAAGREDVGVARQDQLVGQVGVAAGDRVPLDPVVQDAPCVLGVVGLVEDHRPRDGQPVEPQERAERGDQQRAQPAPGPVIGHRRGQPGAQHRQPAGLVGGRRGGEVGLGTHHRPHAIAVLSRSPPGALDPHLLAPLAAGRDRLPSSLVPRSSVQDGGAPFGLRGTMLSMAERDEDEAGVLTLAAVPIGRAEDASPRLAAELARATVIAAEDTRRVRWLAASLEVTLSARVVSYYDAVETRRAAELVASPAGRPGRAAGHRCGHARHQRSGLPAGGGGRGGWPAGDRAARAVRGDHRAGRLRAAHRPVLLRGVPAPQAGGAPAPVRRAGRRPAHPGLLRVGPQAGGDAGRSWPPRTARTGRRWCAAS